MEKRFLSYSLTPIYVISAKTATLPNGTKDVSCDVAVQNLRAKTVNDELVQVEEWFPRKVSINHVWTQERALKYLREQDELAEHEYVSKKERLKLLHKEVMK